MREHLKVSNESGIKIGDRLQVRSPPGISYNGVGHSIHLPDSLNQDGMSLIDDGYERPAARKGLGKIAADRPHPEGGQVIIDEADPIRWHEPPRAEPETLDIRQGSPRGDFLQQHVQTCGDAGVRCHLSCHGNIVERYPDQGG
jgi:hypothetical protein